MIYRIELIITSSSLCWSIQRTDYYPYGEPWRYPTGQQYLYSDKELTRADGRHAYTFPARTLLPSLPRWTTPDPLAEQTPWDSPYAYCAANPIANIDPTGLKFTPESAELLSYYESNLESYKLQFRVLTALSQRDSPSYTRFQSNYNELIAAEAELKVLKESDTTYSINLIEEEIENEFYEGKTEWNFKQNIVDVNLEYISMNLLSHELKHAYQFEIGEYSLGNNTGIPFCDIVDEKAAYRRGTVFGGEDYSEDDKYKGLIHGNAGWQSSWNSLDDKVKLQERSDETKGVFKANGIIFLPNIPQD